MSASVFVPSSEPRVVAYEASDWGALAERLTGDVRSLRGGDPLKPVTLVVPSVGMKVWLTRKLADRLGVAANIEAVYPRALVNRIAEAAGFARDDMARFSREQLVFRIRRALDDEAVFAGSPLATYLENDDDGLRRVQLSRRMAATFDRYLAYRPAMISAWDRNRHVFDDEAESSGEAWQARLWRAATAGLVRAHFPALLETLRREPETLVSGKRIHGLPDALFVVGAAGTPPAYLALFRLLGAAIPVRVYQNIPSEGFLDDLPKTTAERAEALAGGDRAEWTHHPLLMTSGRSARTLRSALMDVFDDTHVLPDETDGPETWLARLRRDIVADAASPSSPEAPAARADGTLTFDDCHGPRRETEVLKDRILDALDTLPGLRPRDILVLSPDIGAYAPYIRAVFGRETENSPAVPFSIGDRPAADGKPVFALASALLEMPLGRMTAPEVAAVLESPVTLAAERWGASEAEIVRLRLEDSGVSWGADRAHRESRTGGASAYGTWRDFLGRLRLGLAMDLETGKLFGGSGDGTERTAPLPGVGGTLAPVAGALAARIERLLDWRRSCLRPASFAQRCERFRAELDAWLPADDDAFVDEAKIFRKILADPARAATAAGYDEPVSHAEFAAFLRPETDVREDGGKVLTEGVTFCDMKPLRTVPARAIFLLGVNASDFPRRHRPDAFDLVARKPAPGDPDPTADDRGLFIECLLAARERFGVVFTGRSPEDDTELPRSPVVTELLEEAARLAGKPPETLVTKQPPFPYSEVYDNGAPGLFTYDDVAVAAARAARTPDDRPVAALFGPDDFVSVEECRAPVPAPELPETAGWEEWKRARTEYAKYLLRNRLGIALDGDDGDLPEDELPAEDTRHLDNHRLVLALLPEAGSENAGAAEKLFRFSGAAGQVSPTGLGRIAFDAANAKAAGLRASIVRHLAETVPVALDFTADAGPVLIRFQEKFHAAAGDPKRLLFVRAGAFSEKHAVVASYMACLLALHPENDYEGGSLAVAHVKNDAFETTAIPIPSRETAASVMRLAAEDFLRHRDRPHPLPLKARLALAAEPVPGATLADAFEPAFGQAADPYDDALWTEEIRNRAEEWSDAEIAARHAYEKAVWSPLLALEPAAAKPKNGR